MRDGGLVALDVAPALERLGMSHLLDRWAVDQVLDQLQESPEAVLAVAVSGRSIADTRWQRDVVARLRACAGLARRLVLVVVGAGLVPAGDAWSLIAEMRRLGCCLALGGFGSGGASIGDVVALSPDMVEVDSFLVGWAEQSDQWRVVFSSLVNIARALDVPVIVTGVSTEARYAAARAAGGRWLQGDFIGRVRSTRLWSGAMHEFSKVA
jgi:EAL domain-containing protein (putative c-di-GMP-specific phosphodiesterase class I)